MRGRLLAVGMLLLAACAEEHYDTVDYCIFSADTQLIVRVWEPCASDHRGAELSCDLELENETDIVLTSYYKEGRDPNDACAADLLATCEIVPLEDGEYTFRYGDESRALNVPGAATCAAAMGTDGGPPIP